ncbi:flagellar biosynthesis protein FlhB [Kistimonas asteriae]|uniref:flagellar biosynthesis protein FlhB n=1 Tax=Kistimonas asteriae TaxID=517724 RepID=UPI001BA4FFC6|nr:flagellar biosynthesis protein FlhB [Kistimonas asteriae]
MAENEDSGQERSEEPSEKRLKDARDKGEAPRSRELVTVGLFLGSCVALLVFSDQISQRFLAVFAENFSVDRASLLDTGAMSARLKDSFITIFGTLLPVFGLMILAIIASSLGLGGWLFSAKPLQPQLSRMSILKGLKRMFSRRSIVELIKSILKVMLVTGALYLIINNVMKDILTLSMKPVAMAIRESLSIVTWSLLGFAAALAVIAIIDVPFQVSEYRRKLKMTRQELKDESKETEGRPEVKSRVRDLQQEVATRRMMQEVPEADVIITNPTHFAVALKYDKTRSEAPFVVAKGVDEIAQTIIEAAQLHKRPVVRTPALTRAIYYTTKINQEVASDLYHAVAQILAYVYRLREFKAGRGQEPTPLPNNFDLPEHFQQYANRGIAGSEND